MKHTKFVRFLIGLSTLLSLALMQNALAESGSTKAATELKRVIDENQVCSVVTSALTCHAFVTGFLKGAILTDTAIIKSLTEKPESFSERAIRTRLGNKSRPATAEAGFCLPDNLSLTKVSEQLASKIHKDDNSPADVLYETLKQDYKC